MMYSVFKYDMALAFCNMLSDQDEHIRREALKTLGSYSGAWFVSSLNK